MNPRRSDSLHGYDKYIRTDRLHQGGLHDHPAVQKPTPWRRIKELVNDCERLYDDDETAEMLLDLVRELMSKEKIPND